MKTTLTWYGHSNFQLCGSTSILIDPFFEGNPKCPVDWRNIPQPDTILVTHGGAQHGDHEGQTVAIAKATGACVGAIVELAAHFVSQGVPAAQIANGIGWNLDGTLDLGGAKVTMTQAFHSCGYGVPVGFVIEMPGGPTVYHAGDTCLFSDMALIGERFAIDVALLPVGGVFTMDGPQAAKACALLKAKRAVPMHFGTFPILEQSSDAFVQALTRHAPNCQPLLMVPGVEVEL